MINEDTITMNKLSFRYLKGSDFDQMYKSFKSAFSDYAVPFNLSKEDFRKKFIHKLNIDYSSSPGFFYESKLVGFIFSTVNIYEGKLTAYNGGTGVLEEFRGRRLTAKLYEECFKRFNFLNIERCLLEVLTTNEKAVRVYSDIGFTISKNFHCFKLNQQNYRPGKKPYQFSIVEKDIPNWPVYKRFLDVEPSFLDSEEMVNHNLRNEKVIEIKDLDDDLIGFGIFQPLTGRISQFGVKETERLEGVGSLIVDFIYKNSANKDLTIINIDSRAKHTINFLTRMGFENQLDQFEMEMPL